MPQNRVIFVADKRGIMEPKTIISLVKSRILRHGRGWVFTAHNFNDLHSETGVRTALSRLTEDRFIRRISQGIYDFPKVHAVLGELSPNVEDVAKAYGEKNGAKIQASGAFAANALGLTEQVPAKVIFLTDGPTGRVKIKNLLVVFKKTTVKNMHASGSREALIIQAFKYMGQEHIDETILAKIKQIIKNSKPKEFEKNIQYAPRWIRAILFDLMENRK